MFAFSTLANSLLPTIDANRCQFFSLESFLFYQNIGFDYQNASLDNYTQVTNQAYVKHALQRLIIEGKAYIRLVDLSVSFHSTNVLESL